MRVVGPAAIVIVFCHLFGLVAATALPIDDEKAENRTVEIGDSVVLDCPALNPDSSKNSVIYWTKLSTEPDAMSLAIISVNNLVLSENGRITLLCSTGSHKCALRIQDVVESDSGMYKCSILLKDLQYDFNDSKVRLNVHGPHSSTPSSSSAPSTSAAPLPASTPAPPSNFPVLPNPALPVIYRVSSDVVVDENETATLECYASGAPQPLIMWKRNEKVIYNGNVTQIHGIRKENRGVYDCVADNYFGRDRKSVTIVVEFPPIVRADVSQIFQVEHVGADLKCRVEGFPVPDIEWIKDGVRITSDSRYTVSEVPLVDKYVRSTLRVKTIESSDFGTYVCRAANKKGEAKTEIDLSPVRDAGCPPACD